MPIISAVIEAIITDDNYKCRKARVEEWDSESGSGSGEGEYPRCNFATSQISGPEHDLVKIRNVDLQRRGLKHMLDHNRLQVKTRPMFKFYYLLSNCLPTE